MGASLVLVAFLSDPDPDAYPDKYRLYNLEAYIDWLAHTHARARGTAAQCCKPHTHMAWTGGEQSTR